MMRGFCRLCLRLFLGLLVLLAYAFWVLFMGAFLGTTPGRVLLVDLPLFVLLVLASWYELYGLRSQRTA